jgi:acyl-CoA carboxylase subunit beta
MHQALLAPPLRSSLDTGSEAFARNRADMVEQLEEIDGLLDEAAAGGGPARIERLRARGKLPIRERIAHVLDPDSPFLEISALAGYDSDYTLGGGMVVGIGVIAGVECVIMGNDPSVLGGALTPYALKKWMRALEIARDNRIPYVSFVESAGADLRMPTGGGGGGGEKRSRPAQTQHFAESGRSFYDMIELSKLGVPTVCVVFGSSTAGGAYQPGLSDYVIVVKEQSKVFLAGPPLVKMATGEESDDETLGGARLHAEVSGLGDYFAEDEMDAIRLCREVVSHLNWRKGGPEPSKRPDEPVHDPEDLLGLVSRDLRQPVDVRDVIARVADGSRFEEFKPRYGPTLVCGWASIHGYPVGILGNNGVLYPDSSQKAAHFIQLCNQIDVPLVFLQNITGYMVGKDFEADGIVKKGSQMLNAVTNSTVPHLTVILGSSYGAGTYGMSGRAFGNRFTFLWPTAKIAVVGPK